MKRLFSLILILAGLGAAAQTPELLPFGDMDQWVTRRIKESRMIGGDTKSCYAVGPTATITGERPYTYSGRSPWATSNVMAKVMGITKVSNAVFPDSHGHGQCARLSTIMEHCKAIGVINVDVVVAGTLFLGKMLEPIKSTADPYSKMEMGIPFSRRPKALCFDYKLSIPANAERTYSSGIGKKRTMPGHDNAEVFVILQRRWEDADGNIHAQRVGTGRELFGTSTPDWVDCHHIDINYGDITGMPGYKSHMGLIPKEKSYYARNSKGIMVPVVEEGWAAADAKPTHLMVMFSAGSGEPYTGTLGTDFLVDNIAMLY